jgi:hypothetical protein
LKTFQPTISIDKGILGIAGEFAVATELCRRNIYAQLTLGNRKRTDLLTLSQDGVFLKIEVKAKQTASWSHIRGLPSGSDAFLVFVDFAKKNETDRPDFFILNAVDWLKLAEEYIRGYGNRHPDRTAHLDHENCPVHPEEKGFRGCTIKLADVEPYREAWDKITAACTKVTDPDLQTNLS